MSNATQNSQITPVAKVARSVSRFVRTSIKPIVFKLSRKLSVTYWPGRRRTISGMLLALLAGFVPGLAGAAPTGAVVVAGTATVLKPSSSTTLINQTSPNAILNWQSFSIGAGEAVRFVQPSASAVALNRVIGSDPSRIFGALTANGKVILVNNAGVYFAPGASVDVGGLVASSMSISNASFLSGKYQFEAGAQSGAVANYGQLRGAFVALAAPQVTNAGSIVTSGGATALAAGGRVSLDIVGDKLVSMSVDAATANAAVQNSGSISADGGKVFMSASSANAVLDTVINTSGIVRAASITERHGQIVIDGGSAGVVEVRGLLAASGAGAGLKGGAVSVLGDKVALRNGARIDVSGDTGGGSALVGGDLHGAGGVKTAAFASVDAGAVINADALASGDGGKVVVWADQHTGFAGAISAKGGAQGGDGGFVETSGKATLAFAGTVNTTAAHGATGSLLLDPTDITISNAVSSGGAFAGGTFDSVAATSTLNVADLTSALASSNVIVDTTSAAASLGHIVVANDVTWNSANSLTLKTVNNITNNAQIVNSGSGAINLHGGAVAAGTLSSAGGAIHIAGFSSPAASVTSTSIASAGGNVSIGSTGAVSTGAISAGSGRIRIIGDAGVAINGALSTTNNTESAVVINAGANAFAGISAGGDISVAGGSVSVGAGGRATLYTGSIAGSTGVTATAGAGSGRFRYNSALGTHNFDEMNAPLGTGVNVVYREKPTLTVGVNSAATIYGDALPVFTPSYSGLQNGDVAGQALLSGPNLSIAGATSGSGNKVAGVHVVTVSGAADQLGYGLAYTDGSLTATKKMLTSSGSTAAGKTYDATTTATVNTSATTFAGGATSGDGKAYAGDVVSVNNAAVTSGTFADKNAGADKTVIINGLALQGSDAGNYSIAGSTTATIGQQALTVTATANDKVYDGTTNATGSLSIMSGLVNGETINFGVDGVGKFNSKDVLSANEVTVMSFSLVDGNNGGLASNYSAAAGQKATAHITPKALTATASVAGKAYDGSTSATAAMTINPAGLINSETVIASATGTFNSKNVVGANLVTVNAVVLADGAGLASNYSLASGQTAVAHITAKALTAIAAAPDKIYDGGTVASPTLSITSGEVGAERVSASGSAVFNTQDVLTANRVTVQSAVLANGANGGLASNYSLAPGQIVLDVHITSKALTATAAADNKVYDGNLSATALMHIDGAGLVGTETVSGAGTGTFNSKDVDSANLVTVKSVVLANGANGGLASNYSLVTGQTGAARIRRRPSVAWTGGASGDWSSALNWENGAIPDRANVEKVIIPAGKSVSFNSAVSALNGAVRIVDLDGAGGLVVGSGILKVASALNIGSYAQSAGEVAAGALTAANAFSETGGKLVVTGPVNITQPAGVIMLGEMSAGALSLGGGASVAQSTGSNLVVTDTMTLATGASDVTLSNLNDFGKVVIISARDVTLKDINGLEVSSANALLGRMKVTSGGDTVIASAGGLAIGGDIGGKLVLTAGGAVIQSAGAALHVTGSSSVDAGTNAVAFSEADNHFTGALAVTGSNVMLVDKGALVLGASTVTGSLAVTTAGALTQSGKLSVTGASSMSARGQAVTLGDSGNTFGDKLTLAAATANVTAASTLTVAADIDGALRLTAPGMVVTSANALNLHMNATAGAATVSADKALILGGNVAGTLTVSAAGAITQGGALTVAGNSSITAQTAGSSPVGQSMTLTNAGNDFGGILALSGGATEVTDKNALSLSASNIKGTLQVTASGDVTQTGVLNVTGASTFKTSGAITLANAGNDFGGAVGGSASSITLRDKSSLTISRLSAAIKADLGAGTDLQVAAGGMVDAPVIALSLSPAARDSGFIGSATNKFEVQANAIVTLGSSTPAVPAYFGGAGSQVNVTNSIASLIYANELVNLFLASGKAFNGITSDALAGVTGSTSQILLATQKKADSNAELIDRGLTADLSMPIPYPHEGSLSAKAPCSQGTDCK